MGTSSSRKYFESDGDAGEKYYYIINNILPNTKSFYDTAGEAGRNKRDGGVICGAYSVVFLFLKHFDIALTDLVSIDFLRLAQLQNKNIGIIFGRLLTTRSETMSLPLPTLFEITSVKKGKKGKKKKKRGKRKKNQGTFFSSFVFAPSFPVFHK
ncbi:hypothetical protein PUN28_018858 [Cardiocondyla obscurior]|uniref:Pre-mRNA-splicing factor 38 n=1 Tax=Cardiocondyla obscurior TaxID=286306 RepID=A0AAW2EI92_9HYME